MKKSKNTRLKKYPKLTPNQLVSEINRETYKEKYFKILKSTIYSLIIILAIAILTATLVMPVLEISGTSMSPQLNTGDIVISVKNKNFKNGDIIGFYHGNKILVKRVIAGPGKWVNIDDEGNVYVNGQILSEAYVNEKKQGESNIEYPYQVPDGHWFVLSDDRLDTIDSRNSDIGSITNENIIGKVIFRIWPLKTFGIIN